MNRESRVMLHRGTAVLAAVVLLLAGAGASYLLMRTKADRGAIEEMPAHDQAGARAGAQPAAAQSSSQAHAPLPDVRVPLTPEAVERAGIVVAPVTAASSAGELRLPGTVEPNAYRQVSVTPLVGGRITRVSAQLGDRVRRGQPMAQIYSPELAEAQTRYVSARAMLEAHDRELQRTRKLVDIGTASRQELERVHAEHAAQSAALESARSRLELLGVSGAMLDAIAAGKNVSATTTVPAPIDGIVTERMANVGLNVDPAAPLFTVVDLARVWVIADVYERDFARVRVGTEAAIRVAAYPALALRGRITYIDPQVSPETRTAKLRVEVPNPGGDLRLGMYADVVLTSGGDGKVPIVARSAVQSLGDRSVVYITDPRERATFIEREVRLGEAAGSDRVVVVSGVRPGDLVVTQGSFFLRAERERLGLRAARDTQVAKVLVNEKGFDPATLTLRPGLPATITFVRTTDQTCGTEVVFPSLNIRHTLPLNEPVVVELRALEAGTLSFACGMDMLRGTVVVQ